MPPRTRGVSPAPSSDVFDALMQHRKPLLFDLALRPGGGASFAVAAAFAPCVQPSAAPAAPPVDTNRGSELSADWRYGRGAVRLTPAGSAVASMLVSAAMIGCDELACTISDIQLQSFGTC